MSPANMPKLGFGLMRLPEAYGHIDMAAVKNMVDAYMEKGFNGFGAACKPPVFG